MVSLTTFWLLEVRTVSSIKASVEYSQKDIEDLKPVKAKLNEAEGSLVQVQGNLEYC